MIKNLLAFVGILICSIVNLNAAGSVLLEPSKPDPNGAVTITYTPDKQFENLEDLFVVYYAFEADKSEPKAYSIPMLKSPRGVFVAIVPLQKTTVFGMVKFGDGKRFDDNNGKFWDIFPYYREGKMVENAAFKAAITLYGRAPMQYRRQNDLNKAKSLFEQELTNYPNNITAQIALASIKRDLKEIDDKTFETSVKDALKSVKTAKNDAEATAIIRAYRIINDSAKAAKFEKDYIKKNPKSKLVEDNLIFELRNANDEIEREKLNLKLLNNFSNSDYADNAIFDLANIYLKKGAPLKALNTISQYPKANPEIISEIALYFLGQDTLLKEALDFVEKFSANFEKNYKTLKPEYISDAEWEFQAVTNIADLSRVKGAFYTQMKNISKAYSELNKAFTILSKFANPDPNIMSALIANFTGVTNELNRNDETLKLVEYAIKNNFSTNELEAFYNEICAKNNINNPAERLIALKKEAKKNKIEILKVEKLNNPLIDGKLKSMDGKMIQISDLKGKVVIIDFWATWCGPCRQSFPAMQKVYEKYKNNPNVAILVVNAWERAKDRKEAVLKFLEGKNYTFPIYFDENDETVKKYGVTGIPSKFFLDKNGNIQFKEEGFNGEDKFISDFEDKVELLLAE